LVSVVDLIFVFQLHCTILQHQTGEEVEMEFSSSTFSDVYLSHAETLTIISERNPQAFHKLMAKLFAESDS
jgi:hypothetical protein